MRPTILLLALAMTLVACSRQPSNSYCCVEVPASPSVVEQPLLVSVLPVALSFESPLPWHLEEELSEQIKTALQLRGRWEIAPAENARWQAALLKGDHLFAADLSPYGRLYGSSDLVVVSELIEHQEVPYRGQKMQSLYKKDGEIETVLAMKMRVRVVDLRESEPRVILQEVVHSNHMIRKREASVDYQTMGWGTVAYGETAVGVAHRRFADDVAARIDRYATFMR